MKGAPASLRVYLLARKLPGVFAHTDVLDEEAQLLVELETYAAEENRVAREEHAREEARSRRASPGGGAGRFRKRK